MKIVVVKLLMLIVSIGACDDYNETEKVRFFLNWIFIFPKTLWCGAGNISQKNCYLGDDVETDRCCRRHDLCNDYIEAHTTRHNLTNNSFFTKLNCRCDNKFYNCLKNVNTRSSNIIGNIFFNLLWTKCFRKAYPVVGCIRFEWWRCVQYEYDTTKQKIYQWFDEQWY